MVKKEKDSPGNSCTKTFILPLTIRENTFEEYVMKIQILYWPTTRERLEVEVRKYEL